jgi:uncharacterized C2H2 Zn-finger protein
MGRKVCKLPQRPYPAIISDKPHLTIIAGRKGSGKTHLTIKLLKSPRAWLGVYDSIKIISPTFPLQPVWGAISPEGVTVHLQFSVDVITELMEKQTADRSKSVLLILDDLGEDVHRCPGAKAVFHKLIANSRHLNISIVWLCQKLTQSPTYARTNCDNFITFSSLATRERDCLFHEVAMTDKRSFNKLMTDCTAEAYSTLSCTFRDGQLKYYKNLEETVSV